MPLSDNEFSQKKLEEYDKLEKIMNMGRRDPIWFVEELLGIQLIDYQKWMFMESWYRRYILWLCSRRAGKTTTAAVYLMSDMMLFPNRKWFISANSADQSFVIFKMLEDIALKRVPSFANVTSVFADEVVKSANSETGFIHNQAGHYFRLYNDSELKTLSTNIDAVRGQFGSVLFDETGWQTAEQMAVIEHFADTDTSFSTGVGKSRYIIPAQMPLKLLYASSASDVEFPFYGKYKHFAKRMFMGDDNYFVCDINAHTIMNHSTIDGEKIKPHITKEAVDKSIEEDPEKAERELFNKFRRGGGQNAVVKMETFVRNSEYRVPLMKNDTGDKKFIFCYDPARSFDGSVLSIYQLIKDKKVGYYLRLENCISMADVNTKNKTPLPMPDQLDIIRDQLIRYNGVGVAEWSNIEFYIDAGAGGGGVSAVADQLMADWTDKFGNVHRGMIDPDHKQYETARMKYRNAAPIVHLINPQSHKKIIYDALEKMSNLDLIKYTEYDGKEFIMVPDPENKGEFVQHMLSAEERLALTNIELLKTETSYMCRFDNPNGSVQYELAREKRNTMHDDRAYTNAMGAYALALARRTELINASDEGFNIGVYRKLARKPQIYRG